MFIAIFLLSLLVEWPDDKLNIVVKSYPVLEGCVFKNVYWIVLNVLFITLLTSDVWRLKFQIFALYLILQTYNLCECFSKENTFL